MSPTKKSKGAPPPAESLLPPEILDSSKIAGWGPTLAQWRKAAGLTQAQLAERVGQAQPTIGAYENGARTPEWGTIKRIAAVCGIDMSDNIAAALLSLPAYEQALIRRLVRALQAGDGEVKDIILPALEATLRLRERRA